MKKLLIAMALISQIAICDDHDDLVHFSAHFGMSYAINTMIYGTLRSLSRNAGREKDLDLKLQEMIFSGCLTLMIGLAYKATEGAPLYDMGQSMLWNSMGVGAATISFAVFEW